MNAKQISTMVGRLVEHQSNFSGLSSEDAQWVIQNPKEAISLIAEAIMHRQKKVSLPESLLEFLGTIDIPASSESFIAKEKFVVNTSSNAKVRISYLGDNFKENFLGKMEDPIGETTLQYGKLLKRSVDEPIIAELGGEVKVETTLVEMFSLIEKQGNGQSGTLLTNGYANIFYIRDVKGVLWAVACGWYDDGWRVVALFVGHPAEWDDGDQVFSRNSSEPQS